MSDVEATVYTAWQENWNVFRFSSPGHQSGWHGGIEGAGYLEQAESKGGLLKDLGAQNDPFYIESVKKCV